MTDRRGGRSCTAASSGDCRLYPAQIPWRIPFHSDQSHTLAGAWFRLLTDACYGDRLRRCSRLDHFAFQSRPRRWRCSSTWLDCHWEKPKSLEEAAQITDAIIANIDREWLIGFRLELLGYRKQPIRLATIGSGAGGQRCVTNALFCLGALDQHLFLPCSAHTVDTECEAKPPDRLALPLITLPSARCLRRKDRFHAQVATLFLPATER